MAKKRFKLVTFASLILRKEKKILLIRRYNTGFDDGFYAFAGGGVDGDEPNTSAVMREANEELGITLKKEDLKVVHALHIKSINGGEYVQFFMQANKWEGEPKIMEPNKCDDVKWFSLDALPQNIMPSVKSVIEHVNNNIFYSEFGWW